MFNIYRQERNRLFHSVSLAVVFVKAADKPMTYKDLDHLGMWGMVIQQKTQFSVICIVHHEFNKLFVPPPSDIANSERQRQERGIQNEFRENT